MTFLVPIDFTSLCKPRCYIGRYYSLTCFKITQMKDKEIIQDIQENTFYGSIPNSLSPSFSGLKNNDRAANLVGFNRFSVAKERIAYSPYYKEVTTSIAPYGMFSGRPLIGECNGILGGVYISAMPKEAIVIDEVFEFLPKVWENLRRDISTIGPRTINFEDVVLVCVKRVIENSLVFSPKRVAELHHAYNIRADQKVALDTYIRAGVADNRHITLLGGYLLEKLKFQGLLSGAIALDPVIREDCATDERLVYVKEDGDYWFLEKCRAIY